MDAFTLHVPSVQRDPERGPGRFIAISCALTGDAALSWGSAADAAGHHSRSDVVQRIVNWKRMPARVAKS